MIGEAIMMIWEVILKFLKGSWSIIEKAWPCFALILILWTIYNFYGDMKIWWDTGIYPNSTDGFTTHREKLIKSNEFQSVTLPALDNYDIEMSIPSGQVLHNTVQGNWGLSTDANNVGMTTGIYRDGYSADGAIFKGKSGKKYKRMLEQGPYVIKYSIRKRKSKEDDDDDQIIKSDNHDVKIYVNEKLIHDLKDEGVSSNELKVVGTNYADFGKLAEDTGRGRRKIDYIKFIPREKPKPETKEGFKSKKKSNKGIMNKVKNYFLNMVDGLELKFSYKEGMVPSQAATDYMKEQIRQYLWAVKDDKRKAIKANKYIPKKLKIYMKALFGKNSNGRWRWESWIRCPPLAFYYMHNDIKNGMKSNDVIEKYASELVGSKIEEDHYFKSTGRRAKKKCKRKIRNEMAKLIGFEKGDKGPASLKMNKMLHASLLIIKNPAFKISNEPIEVGSTDTTTGGATAAPSQVAENPQQGGESGSTSGGEQVVVPGGSGNMKCPLNCIQPRRLNEFCEKDIIRMAIGGEDKFFRKCPYTCKNRNAPDYVNYDKSNKNSPYNTNRDGCRNTEAHCVETCSKALVEVDEMGRDLYSMKNNYTKTNESTEYAKSRLFAHKQTSGLFGATDNRLGGSKQGYTIKYKPENPNPAQGPIYYNSVWDFQA
jgi:hypothetical protein